MTPQAPPRSLEASSGMSFGGHEALDAIGPGHEQIEDRPAAIDRGLPPLGSLDAGKQRDKAELAAAHGDGGIPVRYARHDDRLAVPDGDVDRGALLVLHDE